MRPPPLATLRSAALCWPRQHVPCLSRVNMQVNPAEAGGHLLLGRNGSGKTLLASAIGGSTASEHSFLHSGSIERTDAWSAKSAQQVSFESHETLLDEGGTVYRALGVPPGSTPTKACKFLIVRFGLYQILYRPVTAISTGEIRKVLLARALATRPSLLILDNAFDGLDVPSRVALKDLISTMLRGFSQLLVQGVDASATARTQVLLITHRPEEIVDEIATLSYLPHPTESLITQPRASRSAVSLFRAALGEHADESASLGKAAGARGRELSRVCGGPVTTAGTPLVRTDGLRVVRDDAVLLSDLSWCMRQGEHWLIAGGNGAGKSTLSKLLARADAYEQGASGTLEVLGCGLGAEAPTSGRPTCAPGQSVLLRDGVGWVSTELHLQSTRTAASAWDVLSHGDRVGPAAALLTESLGLEPATLMRPFRDMSQGEQKLVLIGAALATRPAILILDEPCQGLDLISRRRVLSLIDAVCTHSSTSLVYITHHYEEVLPCVTHVMHIQEGTTVFMGERAAYEESAFRSSGQRQAQF
jgi:molybdate transport system ATP-binding protein